MRQDLKRSLAILADCFDSREFPEVARIAAFLAALEAGYRPTPVDYARYYRLAGAALSDDPDTARATLDALVPGEAADPPVLVRWTAPSRSALQDEAEDRFGETAALFHPVDPTTFDLFSSRFDEAMNLLCRVWPDMAAEVRTLATHVLVATGAAGAADQFDGGSHYQLWGLLLLNPAFHASPVALAEVLVHEASHLLLFGLTTDEPLVRNPETALYPSPLRRDPRPMDGLFHAAFVSARMAMAMERFATAPGLRPEARDEARQRCEESIANFRLGAGTIETHAEFTPTGKAIFAGAQQALHGLEARLCDHTPPAGPSRGQRA